ncbi:peptidoglycan D,D-transpeptidase FtsI family protein [Marininema halotolerans]|uniref:Cell division protein FtsI/penicillin-binding protein 2 n=1 Tax=Marininema halotolerans TaxID=1155944 RepID=A0A1I6U8J5_9BACL|nr:penicillin-binding protein 2 [Marininema halotolerans]SFS97597.1 Cell division protein FtsI/penicillin-binding protein 2 [Marininema halotolerans]
MVRKHWRSKWIAVLLFFAFVSILVRLYWIQISAVHSFSREKADLVARAQEQQNRDFIVDSGRGAILDRRGRPITYEKDWRLVVFPLSERQVSTNQKQLTRVAQILHISVQSLSKQLTAIHRPEALKKDGNSDWILTQGQAEAISKLAIPGIYARRSDDRSGFSLAKTVIGRLERNPFLIQERYPDEWEKGMYDSRSRIGVTGLEETFEPFLRGDGGEYLLFEKDGRGRPLNGTTVIKEKGNEAFYPYRVVTTLDMDIQRLTERILQKQKVEEGAIVVQDIASGDILAMASQPDESTAKDEQNPWDNRALMETTPGSIFKTVVALAALDTGKVKMTDVFHCNGSLGRYGLTDTHAHGKETFAQAYANSCNIVFAQIAEKVGAKTIELYAQRMGLGQRMIWTGELFQEKNFKQLQGEEKGLIFAPGTSKEDKGAIAQTGIGQRDVRVTPLQAANMVTTLFHNGSTPNPRIVKEIRRYDGSPVVTFPDHVLKTKERIGSRALAQVREMMRGVVTKGTAQSMKTAILPLAGKTGTAQVGVKGDHYNKWMIGYAPYDKPRWAVSVVVRSSADPKEMRGQQIFRQVMEEIYRLDQQQKKEKQEKKKPPSKSNND